MLVVVTAGPVWEEIVEFVNALPAMWDELTSKPAFQDILNTANADDTIANAAQGARRGAAGRRQRAARDRRRGLRLGPVARDADVPRAVPADGAADDHDWLFGFTPPRDRGALAAGGRGVDPRDLTSLIGNLAISVVAATVAGVSAGLLDLPFPLVLAVITGLLDLIPQVGATIAAVILVAVALTVSTRRRSSWS